MFHFIYIFLSLGLELSATAKKTYEKSYLTNTELVEAIDRFIEDISQNTAVDVQLYNGVIWNRKYSYYMSLIWGIRDQLKSVIIKSLDDEIKVGYGSIFIC